MSTAALATRAQVLYRMFDADGNLLYVGITVDLEARFAQHRGMKPWWTEVATITLAHYPDRLSVEAAERQAIVDEAPVHNVALVPASVRPRTPRGGKGNTPQQPIHLEDALWLPLNRAVTTCGLSRSQIIRQFVRWYLRVPGAKLPQRPDEKAAQ